jgi:surfeit locus 1 family protein
MRSIHFQPTLWPTLLAVLGIALTVALGNWQLRRAAEKISTHERLETRHKLPPTALTGADVDPAALEWREVRARGNFEPRYAVYLDNRVYHGANGYQVVMPLKIERSDVHVLVNRGWVAASPSRTELPKIATPDSTVEVRGMASLPSKRFLELSAKVAEGNVWQNLVIERYRQAVPISVLPIVLLQESGTDDHLVRDWRLPDAGANQNYAYALQWFVMAAAIAVIYVVTNVRRTRTA